MPGPWRRPDRSGRGVGHAGEVITPLQMRALRDELTAAGVYRHHEAASWTKLAILLGVLGLAITATVLGPPVLLLVTIPVAAVVAAAAAMLGHEGSHRSFSASPWRNALLNHITFPLLAGLSASYWKHKHDGQHHGHPNVEDADPDLDLWPMVSSQEAYERSRGFLRWFRRHAQGVAFWPLTLFLALMMRIASIRHLVALARRRGVDRAWLADAGCLAIHYSLWLVVPSLVWGVLPAFGFYTAMWAIVGVLLALVFAPAHMGLPVVVAPNHDWQHQLETTRNLRLPPGLGVLFIGLDHQIEHHLFPKIPHQELPRASAIVAAWCARHGLPHVTIGYRGAVADVTRSVRDAWKTPAVTGAALRARGLLHSRAALERRSTPWDASSIETGRAA